MAHLPSGRTLAAAASRHAYRHRDCRDARRAFTVPVAEFVTSHELATHDVVAELGPDPLSDNFNAEEAIERMQAHGDVEIADVLLDQTVIAGIGNVYKSEVLFGARINPFVRVAALTRGQLAEIVAVAMRFMRANVVSGFSRPAQTRVPVAASSPTRACGGRLAAPILRRDYGSTGAQDSHAVAAALLYLVANRAFLPKVRTGVSGANQNLPELKPSEPSEPPEPTEPRSDMIPSASSRG